MAAGVLRCCRGCSSSPWCSSTSTCRVSTCCPDSTATRDQRLIRLLTRSASDPSVAAARAMRGAAEIISQYGRYYEIVGEDWDVDALPLRRTVKILAVADAFETLQMATPVRAAFPKW